MRLSLTPSPDPRRTRRDPCRRPDRARSEQIWSGAAGALWLAVVCGCATEPHVAANRAVSTPMRSPDDTVLPDFGEVRPRQLYRGGQPGTAQESHGRDGYELLDRDYEVQTIVDLTNEPIDRWIRGRKADCARMAPIQTRHLKYVAIPAVEWHPSRDNLIKFLRVFQNPANRPVFLHCSAGENRTGALIAGFRVLEDSWPPEEAKQEMRRFHVAPFWTLVNDRFIDSVVEDRDTLLRQVATSNDQDPVIVNCDEQQAASRSRH